MKKRAQIPDAFTFTIIFSGLSKHAHQHGILETALSIYNSMRAEHSPVKPNLTHTNALLNVCARKNDIDAMLGVAADLPTEGKNAPDRLTFTIILNAIRHAAEVDTNPRDPDSVFGREGRQLRDQALMQGRRLWEEIRDRWTKLDLTLDEDLVCAMGRVLILGQKKQDYHDVLSLLNQTMQIPRQVPYLGNDSQKAIPEARGADAAPKESDIGAVAGENLTFSGATPQDQGRLRAEESNPFDPVSLSPHQYVIPGPKTLSLALDVCTHLTLYRAAQDYWGLLTDPTRFNIEPDLQNYISNLRLLRFRRQSRMTVDVVRELVTGNLAFTPSSGTTTTIPSKVFRIALSTCARDKSNPNALGYAQELLSLMNSTLEAPDPQALESYLTVALVHEPADYTVALRAAQSSISPFRTLRAHLTDRQQDVLKKRDSFKQVERLEDSLFSLASKLISIFDVALQNGREVMSGAERRDCMASKAWLTAWITRRDMRRKAAKQRSDEERERKARVKMEELRRKRDEEERLEKEWAEQNPEAAFRRKWLERNDDRKFRRRVA